MNKKFYTFYQSNPGGYFINDDKICEYVIIHAPSAKEANDIAEDLGIYFDGIRKKIDCECCNDRWYRVDERDGKDTIEITDRMKEVGYKIYADEEWTI
jgi:hypothetical protein